MKPVDWIMGAALVAALGGVAYVVVSKMNEGPPAAQAAAYGNTRAPAQAPAQAGDPVSQLLNGVSVGQIVDLGRDIWGSLFGN